MARLPQPGGDNNQWGDILNNFLSVAHNDNGTLKPLPQSNIIDLPDDLAAKVNTSTTVNSQPLTGDVTITKGDIGLGNVDDTSDADKPISNATQAALDTESTRIDKAQSTLAMPRTQYASVTRVTTTIQAAVNAAAALSPNGQNADWNPVRRRLVVVPAGTYDEVVTPAGFIDIVGETGNPDDVIITSTSQSNATINAVSTGNRTNFMLANLTIEHVTDFGQTPQYAMHLDASQTPGRNIPAQMVAYNCKFRTTGTIATGSAAVGIGVWADQHYHFINCEFHSTIARAVYAHNGDTAQVAYPALLVFDGCTAESTNGPGVYFTDITSGAEDSFMWIDGSIAGSTVDFTTTGSGTNITYLVSPSAYSTSSIVNASKVANAPVGFRPPIAQNDPTQDQYYTGRQKARGSIMPFAPDASAATLTPLRFYYIPIWVDESRLVQRLNIGVAAQDGNLIAALYPDDLAGQPGASPRVYLTYTAAPVAVGAPGRQTITLNLNRFLAPGQYWIGFATDSATAEFICSQNAPLLQAMYYQTLGSLVAPSSATPVSLASGPVPIVSAYSQ